MIGNPGPIGETGKKGYVGIRGQLYKFGKTSKECMEDPNCNWGDVNEEWLNLVKESKNKDFRLSSTHRFREKSDNQDNLNDFYRGNTSISKNMDKTEPILQLRPCVTCDHCDPPSSLG